MGRSGDSDVTPGQSMSGMAYLLRRNVLLLAVTTLIGAAAGIGASSLGGGYRATVVIGVQSGGDAGQTAIAVQSAAVTATSDTVIAEAARALGVDPNSLSRRTTAVVESDTTLIDLSVVAPTPEEAVDAATTVADTALSDYVVRSDQVATEVRRAGEDLLQSGTLSAPVAERARQDSIGTVVGQAQGQSIEGAVALTVVSPATQARSAGVSKIVGGLLGAAAGLLLGLLVALSGGWRRRRRVRNVADLQHVPAVTEAYRAEDVDLLAGRVLDSGMSVVAILDTGADMHRAEELQSALRATLERSGRTTGAVVVDDTHPGPVATASAPDSTLVVGAPEAGTVLARSARGGLPERLGEDVVVIALPAAAEAAPLLYGQSDFFPVVVIHPGTRTARVEQALAPLTAADPVTVLTH